MYSKRDNRSESSSGLSHIDFSDTLIDNLLVAIGDQKGELKKRKNKKDPKKKK